MNSVHQKFKVNFRWALCGSLIYEIIKSLHNLFLLKILSSTTYGVIGGIIALIFVLTRITDLGLTNTLAPFFKIATESKTAFKKIILLQFLPLHLPLQLSTLVFLPHIFNYFAKISPPPGLYFLIGVLVIFETYRSFTRIYLHTAFKSKIAVPIELLSFSIFLAGVWIPYFMFNFIPTPQSVLFALLADSIFCLSTLTFAIIIFSYKKLPDALSISHPKLSRRILKNRITNSILRLSREIFTSNFLTPLFALTFGLPKAGIFFFASSITYSLQSIFRSTLNYPGTAMLADVKNASLREKKEAFNLLCQKLISFIAPIIIFCTVNASVFIKMGKSLNITQNILSILCLFLIITFSEFFFILYEQFYLVEEASAKFLLFKLLEMLLFFVFIIQCPQNSIIQSLITIIAIRSLSFFIVASNAYFIWKIIPNIKTTKKELVLFTLISLLSKVILLKLT